MMNGQKNIKKTYSSVFKFCCRPRRREYSAHYPYVREN